MKLQKKAHLVLYVCVLLVVQSSTGVGGYNLDQPIDKIIPYDYDHSGKLDYLVAYRPGSDIVWILRNTNGVFTQVF